MRAGLLITALAASLGLSSLAEEQPIISGPARIIDGDTLAIGAVVIRINGIDAAELGQRCKNETGGTWPCDEAAADRLEQLVVAGGVRCVPLDRDPYGRIIARCLAGGADVAKALAEEGLVWAFVRYSDEYLPEETAAREKGVGVWRAPTEAPWDYRANRWERAAEESPEPGCPIKGNINQEGERIYHTPWSPWYQRTRIDKATGERWFCDEAEAITAGWRAARFR